MQKKQAQSKQIRMQTKQMKMQREQIKGKPKAMQKAKGKGTAVLLCSLMGIMLGLQPTEALSHDGTVTITGMVEEDGTCKIDTGSQNQTIELPTVSTASLSSVGKTAGAMPFSIKLKECKAGDSIKATLKLSGNAQEGKLKNEATRGAGQVGLEILKPNQKTISLANLYTDKEKASGTGTKDVQPKYDYIARYYALGKATAGDFKATLSFEVGYE